MTSDPAPLREAIARWTEKAATPFAEGGIGDELQKRGDAYLADYVLSTDGADYEPTEFERALLADAFAGLLSDEALFGPIRAILSALPTDAVQPVGGEPKGIRINLVKGKAYGDLAIRHWANHGLTEGEHRLYAAPCGVWFEVAEEARRYAQYYPQASDGRNTFVMFAEWADAHLALYATAPTAGSGWVMVPREPTEAMLDASYEPWLNKGSHRGHTVAKAIYQAMITAAPTVGSE